MFFTAHQPQARAKNTMRNTMNLLRALYSIILAIIAFHPAAR